MNNKDFIFLENFYKKAKKKQKEIQEFKGNPEDYAKLKEEFEDIDFASEVLIHLTQETKTSEERLEEARKHIFKRSNSCIDMPIKLINEIVDILIK